MTPTPWRVAAAVAAIVLIVAPHSHGDTRIWTGLGSDRYWSTSANWENGTRPIDGDDVIFPGDPSGGFPSINDLPPHTRFESITFAGRPQIKGAVLSLGAGGVRVSSGQAFVGMPLALSSPQTWNIAEHAKLYASGAVDIGSTDLTFNLDAFGTITFGGPISGSGSLTVRGGGGVHFYGAENGLSSTTGRLTLFDATAQLGNYHPGEIYLANHNSRLFLQNGVSTGRITADAGIVSPPSHFQPVHVGGLRLSPDAAYWALLSDPVVVGYGKMFVKGTVTLDDASLVLSALAKYTPGTEFTIIENDGGDPVIGTFKGLSEQARLMPVDWGRPTGQMFAISYVGGDGNDVVLTADPLPDPANVPAHSETGVVLLIVLLCTAAYLRIGS